METARARSLAMEGRRRNPNRKAKQASAAASFEMEKKMVRARSLATERRRRNASRKAKHVSARRKDSSVPEGGEILKREKELGAVIMKRKKELMEATAGNDALLARKLTEEEAQQIVVQKMKRMKVVKRKVPQGLIDFIKVVPCPVVREIPDDELAKCSEHFRESHAREKAMSEKTRAYHMAILDQYNALGYAIDETEVTDNEMEN